MISFLEKCQGIPLVLLHGVGSAARSFAAQLEGLSLLTTPTRWKASSPSGESPTSISWAIRWAA